MFWLFVICIGFILIAISFFTDNLLLTQVGFILVSIGIFFGINVPGFFLYIVDYLTSFFSSYDWTTFFDPF